ncbi:hypothetical protein [Lewinella sp. IMCC34191]|uniref:hypothetical protein n=1 Tax=Lewinella sp. IMCC34191 TaxID=2259172 RepID=UPI000E25367F|nr:hypothetical protein [Lewinella sp. IMCC34191]
MTVIVHSVLSVLFIAYIVASLSCNNSNQMPRLPVRNDYIVIGTSRSSPDSYYTVGEIVSIQQDSILSYSILDPLSIRRFAQQDSTIRINGNLYLFKSVKAVPPHRTDTADQIIIYIDAIKPIDSHLGSILSSDRTLSLIGGKDSLNLTFYDYQEETGVAGTGNCLQISQFARNKQGSQSNDLRAVHYGIYDKSGLVIAVPDETLSAYQYFVVESEAEEKLTARLLHTHSRIGYEQEEYLLTQTLSKPDAQIDSAYADLSHPILERKVRLGFTTHYNDFRARGGVYDSELESLKVDYADNLMQLSINDSYLINDTYRIDTERMHVLFDKQCAFNSSIEVISGHPHIRVPLLVGSSLVNDKIEVTSSSATDAEIDNIKAEGINLKIRYVLIPLPN